MIRNKIRSGISVPRFYFLHIPKTAGSSLDAIILNGRPPGSVLNCPLDTLARMSRDAINQYYYFSGHWGTSFCKLVDRSVALMTLLRDPLERTISSIRYTQACEEPALLSVPAVKAAYNQSSLLNIVTSPLVAPTMFNTQALYLGYTFESLAAFALEESRDGNSVIQFPALELAFADLVNRGNLDMNHVFIAAKEKLDEMAVIGITESLYESADLICRYLGIPMPKELPRERVSRARQALGNISYRDSGTIPADVIREIDALTECDREVYQYARQLFDRQLMSRRRRFFFL